jgi:hypothetical protein
MTKPTKSLQVGIPCFSYEGDCEKYINFAIQSMILTASNPKQIEFLIGLNSENIDTSILTSMKSECYDIKLIDVIGLNKIRVGSTPNASVHNTQNSLNHGEVLDVLFGEFDSVYGMWVDADMAFLIKDWDTKFKLELNEKCAIIGMDYPKNRNRYMNFPTIMGCMFFTDIFRKHNISFTTKHSGSIREMPVGEEEARLYHVPVGSKINLDTGEMLPFIQKYGYTGKCLNSVHLFQNDGERIFLDGDIDDARKKSKVKGGNGKVCEAQLDGEVFFTHLSESRYRTYNEDPLSVVWLMKAKTWLKEKYNLDIEV